MLKVAAKAMLSGMVRRLPWGARQTILDALLDQFGRQTIFYQLGHERNIAGVAGDGNHGLLFGPLSAHVIIDRYIESGAWAPDLVRLFQDFFARAGGKGAFLDIGANIGAVMVPIARSGSVVCHGFEPTPENYRFLEHNVVAAGVEGNCTLHRIALLDRAGIVEFALSPANAGDNRVSASRGNGRQDAYNEGAWQVIEVTAKRLDDVLDADTLVEPIAVKIDTQGAEPAIIAGGRRVLQRASLMSIEFAPYWMDRLGGDIAALIAFLREHFSEGEVFAGDIWHEPSFAPIGEVADELDRLAADKTLGTRYFDVLVRK